MSLSFVKLADIAYLTNANASVYSNPSSTKTYIRGFVLFNNNTAVELVDLYNVPDAAGVAGTAGNGNRFLSVSLAAKETFTWAPPYPITLSDTADTIQGKASSNNQVTIQILGDKDP